MAKQAEHHNTMRAAMRADEAVRIGIEIADLWRRYNELDQANSHDPNASRKIYREAEKLNVWDRISVLRATLATTQAQSAAGALAQVAEIGLIVNAADSEGELTRVRARAIERLCFSAIEALAPHIPQSVVDALNVRQEHLNPFLPYERRFAMVSAN